MKRLGITQRVAVLSDYDERRDCLDQRWASLARELGFMPLPLPNLERDEVGGLLDALDLDALVLSGGNSIASLDPNAGDAAPERDAFEAGLLDEARRRELPLVGVCRGMQMINLHFGGGLALLAGHVATRHELEVVECFADRIDSPVNSYHAYAILPELLAPHLEAIAVDGEGCVEAFVHSNARIAGVMWHPERESPVRSSDVALLRSLLR